MGIKAFENLITFATDSNKIELYQKGIQAFHNLIKYL